ncbi:MAG: hypothetical protein GF411_13095 [Candidatus Lokiarchaeota archaeon]|nr:hypothetical protein [Candidatus Lokiarchaeota archaeon]
MALPRVKILLISFILVMVISIVPRSVCAAPHISNVTVTEEFSTMDVEFLITTNGDYQTVVYEEDVVILTTMSVRASGQYRSCNWDKNICMKGLHWAIRITDDDGVRWINGTYEKGDELVTVHGITATNTSISFHIEAILECDLVAYRDEIEVYSGHIGPHFATIEFIRNGSVGSHTYNITFTQTRFDNRGFTWQLDHVDIITEELQIPTVTVTVTLTETVTVIITQTTTVTETITVTVTETSTTTITETITVTVNQTVIITQNQTIIVTQTDIVTVTEFITIVETRNQTIYIPQSSPLDLGLGAGMGVIVGMVVIVAMTRFRRSDS